VVKAGSKARQESSRVDWPKLRQLGTLPAIADELGRMRCRGDLTEVEAEVGRRGASIYRVRDRAIGSRRHAVSPSLEGWPRALSDLHESDEARERAGQASDDFAAPAWPPKGHGKGEYSAIVRMCVEDRPIPLLMLRPVRQHCLAALARRLGVDRRRS